MSDQPQKPLWQTILISLVMTALLAGIAWAVWTYANSSVQNFAPGTFAARPPLLRRPARRVPGLSILDRIIEFVKAKLGGGH